MVDEFKKKVFPIVVLQREENTTTNVRIRYVFPNQDRVFYRVSHGKVNKVIWLC